MSVHALNAYRSTDLNSRCETSSKRDLVIMLYDAAIDAMGVAQGAKDEAETAMSSMIDRWLADRDFVTREEFDAVRAMAQKAREENEALKTRLDALENAKR